MKETSIIYDENSKIIGKTYFLCKNITSEKHNGDVVNKASSSIIRSTIKTSTCYWSAKSRTQLYQESLTPASPTGTSQPDSSHKHFYSHSLFHINLV